MTPAEKEEGYRRVEDGIDAYLEECTERVGAMATLAAFLKEQLSHIFWVGFYLADEDGSLRVGPYQGPPATPLLPAGKGVCGAALREGKTLIVPDVHAFPGHIACDCRSRSEIALPFRFEGGLAAVLDVDSALPAAFDETDRRHLEELLGRISSRLS
ncbi:MAG: GAF domain-containing protein [Planctomycetaceae bacterium]